MWSEATDVACFESSLERCKRYGAALIAAACLSILKLYRPRQRGGNKTSEIRKTHCAASGPWPQTRSKYPPLPPSTDLNKAIWASAFAAVGAAAWPRRQLFPGSEITFSFSSNSCRGKSGV